MKRIIKLTERDLTRIVKRVINERQYLMEDTTKDVVYTTITLYYDLLPNNVKKRVQYMSFSTNVSSYKTEDIQTIKSFDLGGTVLSPTAQKMSPEKVITGTLPYNKSLESLIGKGASTSTANTLIPTIKTQEGKVTTSMTPLAVILTVVEQQRQTPTQKESDLSRIIKKIINERQYLSEQTIASTQAAAFVNEFNRVMTAYKLPAYTAKYVKGADDYHGNIVIYKDGKELAKSPQDFGIAVTANLSPGVQQEKDPLDNYSTKLVDGKLMQFNTSLVNVLNTADAAAKNQLATAVRSGVDAVRKQLSPTQK